MIDKQEIDFDELLENAIDPMLIIQGDSFYDCNKAAMELFKFKSQEECRNTYPWQVSPAYQPDGTPSQVKANQKISACYLHGKQRFLWLHQSMDNQLIWVEVTILTLDKMGESYIHVTLRDIIHQPNYIKSDDINGALPLKVRPYNTCKVEGINRNSHHQLLKEHKKIIDVACIVSKTDTNGIITYVNDNFCRVSGYRSQELIGQNHNIISHPDVPAAVYSDLWETISKGNIWQGVIKNKKKNGEHYVVKSTIAPIFNQSGTISEYIAVRYDITDLYNKDRTIAQQCVDELTQLNNNTKLANDLKSSTRYHVAIVCSSDLIDIQSAYFIDEYHRVIYQFAQTLDRFTPDYFQLYRYSESKIAILVNENVPFNTFIKRCVELQNYVAEHEIDTENNSYSVSITIGLAQWNADSDTLNQARMALTGAEEANQNISIFNDGNNIHHRIMSTMAWTNSLKSALLTNNIVIFGQKIVDKNEAHYSTEVLMRFYDQDKNLYISPHEFLHFAKRAKIYTKLTQAIITKAFEYFAQTHQKFSVNLSKADIDDRFTNRLILSLLDKYELGSNVIFELVESENYDMNDQQFIDFLLKVKQRKCQIAIDDFGSGYSNFEYLTRMPIDIIKIDGSLIKEIDVNKSHHTIVKTIVDFCHSLDIKVVAEYVAHQSILNKVSSMGVDFYQGYHFHEPEFIC